VLNKKGAAKLNYGHFSKDNLEYIITNPNTPRPWINYLTNTDYCSIISQTAGGYSFYKDCGSNRVTRWEPGNYITDRPGKYVYIKDKVTKKCWSATYQPMKVKPSFYECRHGLGYTQIKTVNSGIESEATYFVPDKDTCEVWIIKLRNKSKKKRTLSVTPYVEWLIGGYQMELGWRNIMNLYNRIWYEKKDKTIYAKKTAQWGDMNIQRFKYIAFFGSSLAAKKAATIKGKFIGRYNTEENPISVTGEFQESNFTSGEDGIAAFLHEVTLGANETKEFVIVLGQTENKAKAQKMVKKYSKLSAAKKALKEVKKIWYERIVNNIKLETPDKDFNSLFNVWTKYQLYICNYWSRSPSYYHEGSGGRGYRDSCQDAEAVTIINKDLARKKIKDIASVIREDGTSSPNWSDLGGYDANRPCKDHPAWLTSTVASYVKETGDKGILNEKTPYLKDRWIRGWFIDHKYKKSASFVGGATIYEHLWKNLDFTFNDTGKRGLPLIGHADWNDGIDAAGKDLKGESVWLAQALVRSLKLLLELSLLIGKKKEAVILTKRVKIMTERINKVSWDGAWYKRGFTDSGYAYGSAKNKKGKIFLNTQSWAVLSGVPSKERQKKLLKSVDKYLDGKCGLALFSPAYSDFDGRLGRMTMFSEGTKENAAVFCHAAAFMVVANCEARRGEKAYQSLRKIMPNAQSDMERYLTEPYSFAEYLIGPDHPYRYGEGAFTWITGTAGWAFSSAVEYILGARKDYEGLRIDPCIPKKWKKYTVIRPFRGAIYDIIVRNPKGKETGVKEVIVDGKKIEGNLIKPHKDGKTHKVEVLMG